MISNNPCDEILAEKKPQLDVTLIETDPLLTVEDMAHYLRLKPGTVRRMARLGELPSIKVGRVWRFKKSQVKDWLVANNR